jgi:mannose-1-phosphate guanylyltransferase / mannose-6-phosphate isomerase
MAAYKVGDTETRPWGAYVVTAVGSTGSGEEFCEKDITVNPGKILSLQSHIHRREHWRVVTGVLTVVLDGQVLTLNEGEDVNLPEGAIHAMANLSPSPVVVRERQEGTCREEDIARYTDAYGRADTPLPDDERGRASLAVYKDVLEKTQG